MNYVQAIETEVPMRTLFYATIGLAAFATTARADSHYSDLIRTDGLAGAEATLAALDDPTPSDAFALGGVRFLSAVEGALQTRYRHDMNSEMMAMMGDMPFLRLPVAPNPAPEPFRPDVVTTLFGDAIDDLGASLAALDGITDDDTVAVTIRPDDLWFDINGNAVQDPGEALTYVVSDILDVPPGDSTAGLAIRFDTADVAWLSAYAHMLSGLSELILSTDPEQAVREVFDGAAQLDRLRGPIPLQLGFFSENELGELDTIAALIVALEGPLDGERTRAAHQHFKDGLSDNRVFWRRVALETDNDREWIPNDAQQSAMPIVFPAGIGDAWQEVLSDAEAILDGRLLLPHWRLASTGGIDLASVLQSPPNVDIIGLLQGYTFAEHVKRGQVVDVDSLRRFDDLTGGASPFFAIVLN